MCSEFFGSRGHEVDQMQRVETQRKQTQAVFLTNPTKMAYNQQNVGRNVVAPYQPYPEAGVIHVQPQQQQQQRNQQQQYQGHQKQQQQYPTPLEYQYQYNNKMVRPVLQSIMNNIGRIDCKCDKPAWICFTLFCQPLSFEAGIVNCL